MDISYKDLKSLFANDLPAAIDYCQVIVSFIGNFDSFNDFKNFHIQNSKTSACQKEWECQIHIHCDNCSLYDNSCLCLECFLNGNHEGHDYHVITRGEGNCDCGDMSQWKRSGFCAKHHGLDEDSHPENYLNEDLRTILTDVIFKACFSTIKHLQPNDTTNLSIILQFLQSFLSFGDGFRRLLAISLTERINFEKFFNIIFDASLEFNEELQNFFIFIVNDQVFRKNFAALNFKLMINKIIPVFYKSNRIPANIAPWESIWYRSYQPNDIIYQIEHNNLDCFELLLQLLVYMKDLFLYVGKNEIPYEIPYIFRVGLTFAEIIQTQPIEKIQNFFNLFITKVINSGTTKGNVNDINDTIIVSSFNGHSSFNHFAVIQLFNACFYDALKAFKMIPNLKIEKLFDELERSFDISQIFLIGKNVVGDGSIENENDKFISRFLRQYEEINPIEINDDNYKSFPKGSSFFFSHLMLSSLTHLIQDDNYFRIKVARILSEAKYQSLRIKLAIATLKNLVARVCYNQSLVFKYNFGISRFFLLQENNRRVSKEIPLLIPLLQLTIGLQCNENKVEDEFAIKEFFAFEMSREIGLFDDNIIDSDNEKMNFSFLYLIILLVIERTLFNFNGNRFIKEQLSFEIKNGVSHFDKLYLLYDVSVANDIKDDLRKMILEIATVKQKNKNKSQYFDASGDQDISLVLKDSVEVNPISAIISINRENEYMNNEIAKNPNELIKIQSFEPEETYFFNTNDEEVNDLKIRLKELLFTPTVLAIAYKCLRNESEFHKIGVNEHLAMNILVLISKFINETESQESEIAFNETTTITYDSTLVDLISQLKRVVFNYKVDENGDATLQNTLAKNAFSSFLKMKIGSNKESPKSFIEILLEKGAIGKSVLNQMSVEVEEFDKDKEDSNITKKMRVKKLKEDILNHFKSSAESFNPNDDDTDSSNVEKESCSICSNVRKKNVLCYPLYLYRTKFPFIVDKPPLVKMHAHLAVRETDIHEDDNFKERCSLLSFSSDDDDDENEEYPSLDEIFARMINENPELDITNDLSEEEAERRRLRVEELQTNLLKNYEQMKHEFYESKNQKRKMFMDLRKEDIKKQMEQIDPNCIVTKQITAGNNFVIQFGICQHLVHHDCVRKKDFTCSIDRTFKNCLLPNIDDLTHESIYADNNDLNCEVNSETLSDELKESLKFFIDTYSQFIKSEDGKIIDIFVELVKSISGLISTYEVRLRSLPDCLDSMKSKYLPRNLFLTTWYAYRMQGKPTMKTGFEDDISDDVDSKLTLFQRFIKKLIECDDIEGVDEHKKNQALNEITTSFIKSFDCQNLRNEKELLLFLKRVCLADHFLLKKMKINENEENKIIVWDEVLSSQNLSQLYCVSFQELGDFEFKPFVFSKMPKEFIRFAQNPYNFPVDQVRQITLFSILDYNKMILNYSDFDENDDSLMCNDYLNNLRIIQNNVNSTIRKMFSNKNYPSVLLFITGYASSIYVVDQGKYKIMKPFYLDKFGCTDIGFARSQALFLNEERYERVMDEILSGEFTNGIKPF